MNRCGALAAVTSTPGAAQVNVNALFTVNGVEVTCVVCVPSAVGVPVPLKSCALQLVMVPAAAPQITVAFMTTVPQSTGTATTLATAPTPPAAESV